MCDGVRHCAVGGGKGDGLSATGSHSCLCEEEEEKRLVLMNNYEQDLGSLLVTDLQ